MRFFCNCGNIRHALEIEYWEEILIVTMTATPEGFFDRVKGAWRYLMGDEPCVAEVVLSSEDREKLLEELSNVCRN